MNKKADTYKDKVLLSVREASEYFNLSEKTIRRLSDAPDCPFVLFVGSKRMIKRELFYKYIMEASRLPDVDSSKHE